MKLVSFNVGYFLGYNGFRSDYIRHPVKGFLGSNEEVDRIEKLVKILEEERPEAMLLQEVDGGSFRTNTISQEIAINERLPDEYEISFHTKYRGFLSPRLPVFRFLGNAVIHKDGSVQNHVLSFGRKALVQELNLANLSVFSLHLATIGSWIREKQMKQLAKLLEEKNTYVVAGDFNLHNGRKEIRHSEEILGHELHSPGRTFPAGEPRQRLDLAACSDDLKITNIEDLGNRFSDHRPIRFEVNV